MTLGSDRVGDEKHTIAGFFVLHYLTKEGPEENP